MVFFKLSVDHLRSDPHWSLGINEAKLKKRRGDIWAYSRGSKCEQLLPVPCQITHRGEACDYNSDGLTTVPIVSERLAALLKDIAADDIQLIPAQLNAQGLWQLVNVLPVVDAIDHKKSSMTYYPADHPTKAGKPESIGRLIIDESRVGNHHLFRVKDYKVIMIASSVVKQRCQEAKMSGMYFIPTELDGWARYYQNPNSEEWCIRTWRVRRTEHRNQT